MTLESILGNVLAAPVIYAFREALKNPKVVNRAAMATKAELEGRHGDLIERLEDWASQGDLAEVLLAAQADKESLAECVVRHFAKSIDYGMDAETLTRHTGVVLGVFFRHLETQVLRSDEGLNLHHKSVIHRMETLPDQIAAAIDRGRLGLDENLEELFKERRFATALSVLDLRLRKPEQLTTQALAPLLRARALCHLEFGNHVAAREDLQRALDLGPDQQAKALLSLALLSDDAESPEALKLAEEFETCNPGDHFQFAARLRLLVARRETTKLSALAKESGVTPRQIRLIGQWLLHLGDLDGAESAVKASLAGEPGDPLAITVRAMLRLTRISAGANGERRFAWSLSDVEQEILATTGEELDGALAKLDARELPIPSRQALVARANIAEILGQYEDAIRLARTLQSEVPESHLGWLIEGRTLRAQGRVDEAIKVLGRGLAAVDDDDLRCELMKCLHLSRRVDEVVDVAAPLLGSHDLQLQADAFDLSLASLRALGRHDDADALAAGLGDRWREAAALACTAALDMTRSGRGEDAVELLRAAREFYDEGHSRAAVTLELGRAAYWANDYTQAVEALEGLVDESGDVDLLWILADSLRMAGRAEDAHMLATRVVDESPYDQRFARLKAQIEWDIRDIPAAIETLHEVIVAEPDALQPRLNLLQLLFLEGREAEARDQIDGSIAAQNAGSPAERILLAQILAELAHPAAREVAYRAVRDHPNDPQTLSKFVAINMRLGDEPQPQQAGDGVTVHLTGPGGEDGWTLDGGQIENRRPDEIGPGSQLWRAVEGASVGDQFVLGSGDAAANYRVDGLETKTATEVKRAFRMLTSRFASAGLMQQMPVGENLVNIYLQADERARHVEHVLDQYYAGKIPLGIAAGGIQRDLASLWLGLATADERGRVGGRGNDEETAQEIAGLQAGATLILTTTGLLALDQLELLEVVAGSFERVVVTRAVQYDVQRARALNSTHAGHGFFGKINGEFVFREYPEEYFVMVQELYGRLTDVVAAQEMVRVWERSKIPADERELIETMDNALGASAVDAALLARSNGYVIVEDDMVTREILRRLWGVESTSIQSLIAHLLDSDQISQDSRNDLLARLATSGYKFLRVDQQLFAWLIQKPDAAGRAALSAALNYLKPPCTAESAGVIGAQIVKDVWLGRHTVERRLMVLFEVAASLHCHDGSEALDVMEAAIPRAFGQLLVLQARQALKALRDWRAATA